MKKSKCLNFMYFSKLRVFLLIILLFVLSLTACSSDTKASEKAISVAKSAIEVADNYLDNKISKDEADSQLSSLKSDMSYVDDMEQNDEHKATDFSISSSITMLSTNIFHDSLDSTNETYDKILETRNDIAEKAGLEKR